MPYKGQWSYLPGLTAYIVLFSTSGSSKAANETLSMSNVGELSTFTINLVDHGPQYVAVFGLSIFAVLLSAAIKSKSILALISVLLFFVYAGAVTFGAYRLSDITKSALTFDDQAKQYEKLADIFDKLPPGLSIQVPKAHENSWLVLMRARLEVRSVVSSVCHRARLESCGTGLREATTTLEKSGAFRDKPDLKDDLIAISEATYAIEYGVGPNTRVPNNKQMAEALRKVVPVHNSLMSIVK